MKPDPSPTGRRVFMIGGYRPDPPTVRFGNGIRFLGSEDMSQPLGDTSWGFRLSPVAQPDGDCGADWEPLSMADRQEQAREDFEAHLDDVRDLRGNGGHGR